MGDPFPQPITSLNQNTTFKGVNYHFDQRLNIYERDGTLAQKIDIWRTIGNGLKTLVYTGDGTLN